MAYSSDEEAIEIWKAKWRGEGVQSLVLRYKKSPFRFYEIWTEAKNPGTRLIAFEQFKHEAPHLALHVDTSPHTPKRKVIVPPPGDSSPQLDMFP
ncbi:hypothetical protein KX729_24350 [Rhizobium sp. XQZ8]|uniref:hypothetical protein n=1 Tax=Rhizobium populisoli TaxID=2859785 RepID=UPI001CA518FF|nr:hypothetical protein [Rhizobium populisoli]MBW6424587.1 hypothetical protein [Rhizobium populisoli]